MRDIVWTVIVIWIAWKVYDAFTNKTKKQPGKQNNSYRHKEGEVKIEKNIKQKPRFNDGEYVDYEEIK